MGYDAEFWNVRGYDHFLVIALRLVTLIVALLCVIYVAACGGDSSADGPRGVDTNGDGRVDAVDFDGDGRADVTCSSTATATADNGSTASARSGDCNVFFPTGSGNVGHDQDNRTDDSHDTTDNSTTTPPPA